MSEAEKDVKFSLKVMVNEEKTKVLFAQVDSSFADVLLSFLTLPLGTIVRILKKHYGDETPVFGSLTTLYNGLENLDSVHFWTNGAKSVLLHPRSSFDAQCESLKLDISDFPPLELFFCANCCPFINKRIPSISMYYDTVARCPFCHRRVTMVEDKKNARSSLRDDGGVTISSLSLVITDDLQILPPATGLLQIASSLGITDMDKAEQVNVTFGFAEVMNLLKASLISSTPLSYRVLMRKFEHGISSNQIGNASTNSNSKKMILRVMVQRSANKLLYAQAEEDFVEFLFSFLIIPLGGVEYLLSSNSLMNSIDNLHRSLADVLGDKYFETPEAKEKLIKPKIPHGYISDNNILPLIEEELTSFYDRIDLFSSWKFPKGKGNYLKPRTFMVTDNLTVAPICIASTVSYLKGMKIAISDVKEVELQVGLKEALSILRASLTSTCALSNGLNLSDHLSSLKQPKQEH